VAAVVVTLLFVLLRSAQVTGVTQMQESKILFERVSYEFDNRYILMRGNEKEAQPRGMTWEAIDTVRRDKDAYLMYLKQPDVSDQIAGWRAWLAKLMWVPVFLHLPTRIFNSPNDLRLFDSILRRKGLLPADAPATDAAKSA
jgi:hypothetical protein